MKTTKLEWSFVGSVNSTTNEGITCCCLAVKQTDTKEVKKRKFQMKTSVKESHVKKMLNTMHKDFIEPGFTERSPENDMPWRKQKFLENLRRCHKACNWELLGSFDRDVSVDFQISSNNRYQSF